MLRFDQLIPRGDDKKKERKPDYFICADPYNTADGVAAVAVFSVVEQRIVSAITSKKRNFEELVDRYRFFYKNNKIIRDKDHARKII